jgi:hypothetical protein
MTDIMEAIHTVVIMKGIMRGITVGITGTRHTILIMQAKEQEGMGRLGSTGTMPVMVRTGPTTAVHITAVHITAIMHLITVTITEADTDIITLKPCRKPPQLLCP